MLLLISAPYIKIKIYNLKQKIKKNFIFFKNVFFLKKQNKWTLKLFTCHLLFYLMTPKSWEAINYSEILISPRKIIRNIM